MDEQFEGRLDSMLRWMDDAMNHGPLDAWLDVRRLEWVDLMDDPSIRLKLMDDSRDERLDGWVDGHRIHEWMGYSTLVLRTRWTALTMDDPSIWLDARLEEATPTP